MAKKKIESGHGCWLDLSNGDIKPFYCQVNVKGNPKKIKVWSEKDCIFFQSFSFPIRRVYTVVPDKETKIDKISNGKRYSVQRVDVLQNLKSKIALLKFISLGHTEFRAVVKVS